VITRIVVPLLAVAAACGDAGSTSGTAIPSSSVSVDGSAVVAVGPNGEVVEVQVLDNSYRPLDLVVSAGTEVVFVNKGRNEHNILPDDVKNDADLLERLASDSSAAAWGVASADLPPGASFSHVFLEPGTYPYYCSIHGVAGKGMYGIIVVE
jgi:plastocyanin